MPAVLTDEQKSFVSLLNRLERGKTPLDRSLIVRKALLLLANTRSESVSVDVEKQIAMTPPPDAIVRPKSKVNSAPNPISDSAEKDGGEVLAVGEQPLSEQQETIDTIMTISAPCVVSIESSLSSLFASYHSEKRDAAEAAKKSDDKVEEEAASNTTSSAAAANTKGGKKKGGKGGNNKQQKGSETDAKNDNNNSAAAAADSSEDAAAKSHQQLPISSAKHRLLLYRFLLNGLADVREEEQLLMAAAPLFASEASEDHKRSHDRGVSAILSGVLASQNASLKATLKLVPSAEDTSESATGNTESEGAVKGSPTSFAREVLLGLVLYFEQKTNTFVFTSPATATTTQAMSGSSSEHHQQKHNLSKQGRFFDAVAALSYVVAEGLATENTVQENTDVAEAEEVTEVTTEEEKKKQEEGEEKKGGDEGEELKENSSEKPSAGDEHRLPLDTFLSTLFSLLNRFVPIFLPLRGEEQLFTMSAMPDLLRLMLQYHDPILSMHLDRHPQPRRARASPSEPESEHQDDAVASGVTSFSDVSTARTMADAAYHYLTGSGCASLFSRAVTDFASPPATSSSSSAPAPSSPAQINNEVLALLDLIILRYDDSRYFGCLSFIATVLLHRGSILKLSDGEAIATFWGKFAAGAFADNSQICLSALPIAEVEEAAAKLLETAVDQPKDAVKALAMAVLASQSRAHHKDRLPPVLEPLAGLIHHYCCSLTSAAARQTSTANVSLAAIVAVVVRNLAKNTPSSAKVFSTAVLSATNRGQAQSPREGRLAVESADDAAALGAMTMGAVEGMTISESIERHRIYVSSFPVMPVTAEELVLVFPAGSMFASSPDSPAVSSSEPPSPSPENREKGGGKDGEAHTTVAAPTTASSARAPPSGGDASGAYSSSHLQYLVLDSRAENSFLFARLPTAIHIGSGIGFDSAQLAATVFQLQDAWSSHLTIMGTGRTILEEHNLLKLIAMRLVEKGFPYVSIVDGGFKACIPYLKAGQMEFVQSPQEARDECARRDAATAAASHHRQQQQHQQHPNTSRTTLDTTEEIAGEIASQAVFIKDKAAEGLKKTGENLSEAASTAALWGTNVWHKFSTTAKEKLQNAKADAVGVPFTASEGQYQDPEYQDPPESFASNATETLPTPPAPSGGFFSSFISKVKEEAVIASSTVATTASAAAASASSGVVAAAHTASTVVAAAPNSAAATSTAGFFTNLIGKVKGSDASAEKKVSPDSHNDQQYHQQQQQHQQQQAAVFTTASGGGARGGNNAYGDDDDDDDDDLGLILSVEPSSNNLNNVATANNNSDASVPFESELVHPPQTTGDTDSKVHVPAVKTTEKPTHADGNADGNQAQKPPVPEPAVATAAQAAHTSKSVSASNAIDDLFGDMDEIVGGGASRGASPNVTRALPVATKSTSGSKPAASSNVFDDIFGDDF